MIPELKRNLYQGFAVLTVAVVSVTCSSGSKKQHPDAVDSVMESARPRYDDCQQRAIKQKSAEEPVPAGRLELSLTIAPSGSVTNVQTLQTSTNSLRLDECVQEIVKRLKFPSNKQGRLIQTTYALDFKSPAP